MKVRLTSRTWQLLAAAVAVLAIFGGVFFAYWLYPLWSQERSNRTELAILTAKVQRAQKAIASVEAIGQRARETRGSLARLTQAQPMGPAVEWFPARVREHLSRFGITDIQVDLQASVPDPENEEFKVTTWRVHFPPQAQVQDMNAMLLAVAEVEDQERFVRIIDCTFQTDPDNPLQLAGEFNLSAIIRE